MGRGNFLLSIHYEDEHRGEFFYVDKPDIETDGADQWEIAEDMSFWMNELDDKIKSLVNPKSFTTYDLSANETHWGDTWQILAESEMYAVGTHDYGEYLVVAVFIKHLSCDNWKTQEHYKNIGNHIPSIFNRIGRGLLRFDYKLRGRSCAWTSCSLSAEDFPKVTRKKPDDDPALPNPEKWKDFNRDDLKK